jgi:probable F420-dependent oxidoreductase
VTASGVVEGARRSLGRVGAFLPETPDDPTPAEVQRHTCRRLEDLGLRSVWTNELIGKDSLAQLAVMLAATERMVFGTCIANIWARPAQTAHGAAALLSEAYPGRLVVGLGVGYPQQADAVGKEFGRPVDTMRDYLAAMDDAGLGRPARYARILGANRPRMLELAARLTDGALPAGATPTDTADIRSVLGPDRLLVVYLDACPWPWESLR